MKKPTNGHAVAVRGMRMRIVRARKGKGSYSRKGKQAYR